MGAIQIGGQWYFLQPDGSRLGPFPSETEAAVAGTGVAPSGTSTSGTGGTGGTAAGTGGPGTYDPNNPVVGTTVPGTNLVFVGYDVTGQVPQFKNAGRTTTVVNDKLIDAETGQVIADLSDPKSLAAISPTSLYGEQQQNIRSANTLAEHQRQFNEQFGMDKAKINTEFP